MEAQDLFIFIKAEDPICRSLKHHLGICVNCKFSDAAPDLLNQGHWACSLIQVYILTRLLGDSVHAKICEPHIFKFLW